jgi:MFS family permease
MAKTRSINPKEKLFTREYLLVTVINFLVSANLYQTLIVMSGFVMARFRTSEGMAGFIAGIFTIGALLSRVYCGRYLLRIGYKKLLLIGLTLCTLTSAAYLPAHSLWMVLIIRFFHGVSFGLASTATITIIADIVPKARSGEGIGIFTLFQTVGTALGPYIGMLFSHQNSNLPIFASCSAMGLVGLIFAIPAQIKNGPLSDAQRHETQSFKPSSFIETKVLPISIVIILIFTCYSAVTTFIALYTQKIQLERPAGFYFIAFAAAAMVSRPAAGKIFDQKGENAAMYPAIAAFALGELLLSQSHHGAMLLLSGGFLGMGFGAVQASIQAIVAKRAPSHRLAIGFSTLFIFMDLGAGFGPAAMGPFIAILGFRGMYFGAFLIAAICIPIYFIVHGRRFSIKTAAPK